MHSGTMRTEEILVGVLLAMVMSYAVILFLKFNIYSIQFFLDYQQPQQQQYNQSYGGPQQYNYYNTQPSYGATQPFANPYQNPYQGGAGGYWGPPQAQVSHGQCFLRSVSSFVSFFSQNQQGYNDRDPRQSRGNSNQPRMNYYR